MNGLECDDLAKYKARVEVFVGAVDRGYGGEDCGDGAGVGGCGRGCYMDAVGVGETFVVVVVVVVVGIVVDGEGL